MTTLDDRRRALEEEYFRKRDAELIERMRKQSDSLAGRDAMARETGISDDALLQELEARGFTASTVSLLPIVPLLEVAWAEDVMSDDERALIVNPRYLTARNNLGVALIEQFKHEEAAKHFKQALVSDPNFAVARINLALAYFFLNETRLAVEEGKAAVKLAPNSLHAHYLLGAALRNEKFYDEAIAEFNAVLAVDPNDPATNIQIGQIYSQQQKYPQAIQAFRRALDAGAGSVIMTSLRRDRAPPPSRRTPPMEPLGLPRGSVRQRYAGWNGWIA